MAGENERGVIEFGRKELDPEETQNYKNRVAAAKTGVNTLKKNEVVGGVAKRTGLPVFREEKRGSLPRDEDFGNLGQVQPQGVHPRGPGAPTLRPETVRMIEEASAASKAQDAAPPPLEEPKVVKDDNEDDIFEGFNFSAKDEAERVLNNKKRRKTIEGRCKPMNFRDLLERDEVHQIVPIRPGDFEPEYRSMTPAESLFVKQYMAKEENRTEMYLLEKYSLCQLVCGLYALNGTVYTPHFDKNGDVDKSVFETKVKNLTKKSGYLIADLALNYHWFDIRVRKLVSMDEMGNG